METLIILAVSIGAGILAGFLGLGGGVLMIPALTIIAGVPIKLAVGVSLLSVISVSMTSSSVYLRKDMINLELAVTLALASVSGGIVGALLSEHIASSNLHFIFAAVLIYAAVSIVLRGNTDSESKKIVSGVRLALFLLVSFAAGIMTGLLGLGGGIIFVPLLYLGFGLSIPRAIGVSSFLVGLSATSGSLVYFLRGDLAQVVAVIPPVVIGMIVGAKLGGKLGVVAKSKVSKIVFAVMLLYVCYHMVNLGLNT